MPCVARFRSTLIEKLDANQYFKRISELINLLILTVRKSFTYG